MADMPTQRTTAQYTSHDKILIAILGADWLDQAKQHGNSKSWIKACRPAIDNYLAPIGIPPNPLTKAQHGKATKHSNANNTNNVNSNHTIFHRLEQLNRTTEPKDDEANEEDEDTTMANEGKDEEWSPIMPQ